MSLGVILVIAITCFVVAVAIVLFICLLYSRRKRSKLPKDSSVAGPWPKLSYGMLQKATDGFSEGNLVGRGEFGSVYQGILDDESMFAIKVINLEQDGASKSFVAECKALRNIRHRNLLKIYTVCSSSDFEGNDFKALVFEFMQNGNLERWIHMEQNEAQVGQHQTLSLEQRLDIAIDVACALDYLHNGCEAPIIHCDLKPSNILLDGNMVAHVGDFGLARFHSGASTSNSSSVAIKGTVGYAAPEYGLGSVASKEGDVYSYGIVVIEMITAKRPTNNAFDGELNLHHYAKSALHHQLGTIIDSKLLDHEAGVSQRKHVEKLAKHSRIECLRFLIDIGVKCSAESPQDRMKIEDVVGQLQMAKNNLVSRVRQEKSPDPLG